MKKKILTLAAVVTLPFILLVMYLISSMASNSKTKDDILGSDVVSNSTLDDIKDKVQNADTEGWWDKVVNFFKGLTGSDSDSSDSNSSDDSSSN